MYQKRGQLTVFIILAIVLVGLIAGYFILKERAVKEIPVAFRPVEEKFLSCIEDYTRLGINLLETQAGYIYLPDFEPGSAYKPFSSQLNFLGFSVPYWYYVSGNNLVKEQVPTKQEIEQQLDRFIEESIGECGFSEFYTKDYEIQIEDITANTQIKDEKISVDIDANLVISLENQSYVVGNHQVDVNTKLGKFYSLALKIYNKEKTGMFLEDYAIDVLRLYAPVDGVELTCMPKVWAVNDVVSDLQTGLEANIQSLKLKGNYYDLGNKEREYFIIDQDIDEAVNFIYSAEWPISVSVDPADEVMIAEPVGNQEGLGILGFCYVPYHFIYDLNFPVLIQLYDSDEMFQFPVGVVIHGNQPRESLAETSLDDFESETCKYRNQEVSVYTYDSALDPVEADIRFKCFSDVCDIGKTVSEGEDAFLKEMFPQCVNGFILAKAEGYAPSKYQISTNSETRADILLSKLYNLSIIVKLGDRETNERAFVYFRGKTEKAVVWPDQDSVELAEGYYNISVYVYKNSSISVPASSMQKCIDVPKPGLIGIFGGTQEECFDLDIPAQTLDNALVGGGEVSWYISESELVGAENIEIVVDKLPIPTSLDDLQDAYNTIGYKTLGIEIT